MSEKKIVVPEGMLRAARNASLDAGLPILALRDLRIIVEAALLWLSENPIVPTDQFMDEMLDRERFGGDHWTDNQVFEFCTEWQRRMFLAPEPEEPEAIKDIHAWCEVYFGDSPELQNLKDCVSKAYRRGQKAGPR